jgi:hypothetical protein
MEEGQEKNIYWSESCLLYKGNKKYAAGTWLYFKISALTESMVQVFLQSYFLACQEVT